MYQTQKKPIISHFTGTVGASLYSTGATGLKIINDAAEVITVTIGGIAFKVKQNEIFDDEFIMFNRVDLDPNTAAGTAQVETATLVTANVTTAGKMAVIVTAANMTNSPKTVLVDVYKTMTTPALVMAAVRTALANDPDVGTAFAISGAGATAILTARHGLANDATLNVDLGGAGTTAVGITEAAASANTTAGVAGTAIAYRAWLRG